MTRYSMVKLASRLGFKDDRLFLTRERGEQAYPMLAARLREIPDGNPMILDFPYGQLIDGSFADESLIRLGKRIICGEFGDRCVLLQGLTEDSITNIQSIISFDNTKLAFLVVEPSGDWQCVGQLEPSLMETLELVADRGTQTAPDLAKLTGLAINSASNRLKRIYDQRLVQRHYEISDKGLQYIYRFWEWTKDSSEVNEEI